MVGGILITHGPMAQALIKAGETILGKIQYIYGFSTTDLSIATIVERIDSIVHDEEWPHDTLILVSLKGGSCWNAALTAKKKLSNIEVVSGINLSMLLSFVTKRNEEPLAKLAQTVMSDGIRGIDKHE
ncbi:hypothetical protein JXB12_00055 [candidate division KSB1 bacterium]|nr:hypothetical protein [candidate division KSB1 bacterium]